jgi:DNA repair protein RecN (Recombination protein N)
MQPFFAHHELEYEPECILRREVYASGKSRAFINDTPASLSQMKELGEQLIDVHSQHQNLLLNQEGFQLNFIDILAHNDHLLSQYRECYQAWKQHTRRLQELIEQAAQSKADEEFVRFQLQQLDEAALQADEQEELEQEAETLSHAEEIKGALYKAEQLLLGDEGGLLPALKEGYTSLRSVSRYTHRCRSWRSVPKAAHRTQRHCAGVGPAKREDRVNPVRLDEVNTRLNSFIRCNKNTACLPGRTHGAGG